MKVLFVGEGPVDVGTPDFAAQPHPAGGVLTAVARRVCPDGIDEASVACYWREIPILPPKGKTARGWTAKVRSAVLVGYRHAYLALVCVADGDGEPDRLTAMDEGAALGNNALDKAMLAVCGLAVETIEAWTLGALTALAAVLKTDAATLQTHYKPGQVEQFHPNSGKPEKQSKQLLQRLAQEFISSEPTTAFRERVADLTDIAELERTCPRGFRPFAQRLRAAFGPR